MRLKNPFRDMRTIRMHLDGAEAEANRAGESTPGAEHLLLAALDFLDGTARWAFERVGADPSTLRQAIEERHVEALRAVGIDADAGVEGAVSVAPPAKGVYRSSGSAQSAFLAAGKLARETRSQLVGAHVLLAIADMEHGTASVPCAASASTSTHSPRPRAKRQDLEGRAGRARAMRLLRPPTASRPPRRSRRLTPARCAARRKASGSPVPPQTLARDDQRRVGRWLTGVLLRVLGPGATNGLVGPVGKRILPLERGQLPPCDQTRVPLPGFG